MIVYGRNPVREALRGRRSRQVRDLWATARAAREPWLAGIPVTVRSTREIERRCGSADHQGICAEAGGYPYLAAAELLSAPEPLIVVLDQVQDPHNLGSICRTAECAGASGLVIPERRSAEVGPTVCKTSAGAVEHLRVARARNLAEFLAQAKESDCWCYGASAPLDRGQGLECHGELGRAERHGDRERAERDGDRGRTERHGDLGPAERRGDPKRADNEGGVGTSAVRRGAATVSYTVPDYRGGVVLVLGSEGSGLRPRVAAACDQLISLPLRGQVDSLGVAAAAAALLYGILQARAERLDKVP